MDAKFSPESELSSGDFSRFLKEHRLNNLLEGPLLDLGCGTGSAMYGFQRAHPDMPLIGIDLRHYDLLI